MGQLTEEASQASNIKSPQTRKNVQGALRKISNFLKAINFKIPDLGLVIFAGNVSEQEGKADIRLFTVKPPRELKTKLYWCDSSFHTAPLEEMAKPLEVYGLVTVDKNEATIAELVGKKYDIVGHFTSGVAGKTRAGGQSAHRFERLREEAAQDFYKRVSEKVNNALLKHGDKLKGIIIGGPGMTKQYFLDKELVDYRLRKKIIGQVDTSYTDDSGIREVVHQSGDLLRNTELMKEKEVLEKFMEEIGKSGLALYGEEKVLEALNIGKVQTLLVSEGIGWEVHATKCNNCAHTNMHVIKTKEDAKKAVEKCEKCGSGVELLEETDYIDHLIDLAANTGAEVKVISRDTEEGEQFFHAFEGLGAMLRFK